MIPSASCVSVDTCGLKITLSVIFMLRAGMFGDKKSLVRVAALFDIRLFEIIQLRKLSTVADVNTTPNIVFAVQVLPVNI